MLSLLLPVLLLALTAVLVFLAINRAVPEHTTSAVRAAASRHENLTTGVGAVGGLTVAITLITALPVGAQSPPGIVTALAPTAGCLVFLAIVAVGEHTWPRPAGAVRQATLHRRSLRALSPSRVRLLCGTAAVLGIALGVFVLTADETGRAVPAMITAEGALAGRLGGASGPYPGSRYAGPIAVGLIVVLVATAWVLHRVAHRPAVAGATPEDDQLLRRTGARRILGGVQLCVGATSAAVLLVAAVSLTNAGWTLAAWTAGVVGLLCGLTSVIAAGTALPAPQPTTTTVAA